MNKGMLAKDIIKKPDALISSLNLLTSKPFIYLLNVEPPEWENNLTKMVKEKIKSQDHITMSVLLENEAVILTEDMDIILEKATIEEFFSSFSGSFFSQTNKLFQKIISATNLKTFYTIYKGETISSFLIGKDENIIGAARKIHSDFADNFICGEISKINDWEKFSTEEEMKKNNKLTKVNREYKVDNYDILKINFK
jgi:ribosome-binding ATPase YchF (GTP1/OBG family)